MIPDVYHGDPIVDMGAFLANSEFVILKCTQGTGYIDPTYAERSQACRGAGKPFWAYSFMERKSGSAQASHLIDNAGSGYAGLVLDCEDYRGTRPTRAQVQEAYDYITSRGIKCMVYYMDSEAGDYKGIASGDLGADWVARYGRNDGTVSKYPNTACDLHQYTSTGSMPGVSGNCDLSRVTGDGKALEWFMGGATQATTTTGNSEEEDNMQLLIHPSAPSELTGGMFYYNGDRIFQLSNPDQVGALDYVSQAAYGHVVPRYEMIGTGDPWFIRLVETCGGVIYQCPGDCTLDEIAWKQAGTA